MTLTLSKWNAFAMAAALALTLASAVIERTGPELVQYGNLCGAAGRDPCYKPALKGGFPFAYLVDTPGVSVERQLAFVEDSLDLRVLAADAIVYFIMCLWIGRAIARRGKNRVDGSIRQA